MDESPSFGDPTKTLAFLKMNWNVFGASDLYKICEDLVGKENVEEVKICKTKAVDLKGEGLEVVKQSFVGIVKFKNEQSAINVYNELDSTELENSKMFFNICFVNDKIKTGEVVQSVCSGEEFVEKDYNKFNNEIDEERERKSLLEKIFKSKETNRDLLNKLVSISDEEDENLEEKKKILIGEKEFEVEQKEEPKICIKEESPSFTLNVNDSRFTQIYTDSDFTIDPTHPEFSRNKKLKNLILEKRRRHENE